MYLELPLLNRPASSYMILAYVGRACANNLLHTIHILYPLCAPQTVCTTISVTRWPCGPCTLPDSFTRGGRLRVGSPCVCRWRRITTNPIAYSRTTIPVGSSISQKLGLVVSTLAFFGTYFSIRTSVQYSVLYPHEIQTKDHESLRRLSKVPVPHSRPRGRRLAFHGKHAERTT